MDFVHSISEIAQHLQSAVGNYWNGEWENHAGRLPKFDQHGMGSSVAHGAHLSRAGIGATVFSGGYARPPDRRSVRSWAIRGPAFPLCVGPRLAASVPAESSDCSPPKL